MYFALFLGIINLFKLWLARFLPLLGDEAYYSLWSRHLALSYTDHPPMIAYINWLLNAIAGQNETVIRMGAILCLLISTWLIYLVGKEAFGKKVGLASAVLFNLIPTYLAGGLFLTPEQPLIIFWLLCTYAAIKTVKTRNKNYWYLLGLAAGLGLLSKYPMILFLPGILLFLLLSKENRLWFRQKELYLSALLAFLVSSPVLIWNIQHGFPAFLHHGARIGNPNYLDNALSFLLLQFFMYSPLLFIFAFSTFFYSFWKKIKELDVSSLLLISVSLPVFLAFLLISPFAIVGGHWTSIAYLGLIVVICQRWLSLPTPPLRNLRLWLNTGIIILINVLFIGYYAFLFPVPDDLRGREYAVNRELADYVKAAKVNYVFSDQMGVASLVAFYGKTEIYLPQGTWKQFDIWGQPELKKGGDILYFSFDRPDLYEELKPLFQEVEIDPRKRLFTKDSNIPEKTIIYVCRGYKGGRLP
jgi:4-amino-4-deoxy-L-arabinose transferase-like glycosyltransferase